MNQLDATAAHFVESAVTLLVADPRRILERGVRVEDVVYASDSSTATFFRKFSTKADFLDKVVEHLSRTPLPTEVHETVRTQATANGASIRATVSALVARHFPALVDRNGITESLLDHVFSGPSSPALAGAYRVRDEAVLDAFEALFDPDGGAFRRPFTARSFAVTINAIIDGFRLRSQVDATSVSPDVMSDAVLAFLGAVVDTSGHHQHLDDVVGEVGAPVEDRPLPRDPRAAIVTAARDEFGKRGYFMTRMDDVADIAGVPRAACKTLFPTKPSVIVAALQNRVDRLRESVADDQLLGLDELTILRNHMLRCAQLASDEIEFMDALLVAVAHDTYGEPEGLISIKEKLNLPAIIAPVIARGQDSGLFRKGSSPVDLAAGITNTLLMRCFTRRQNSPQDNAVFVGDLLLHGLHTP
ncbi:TetR family transcriptional regulator [Rhodococcus sp. Leaf278]|uniref:TetR family transcriptional regulator C-terminal domain-containing protein n=1 Tax=Rhodococcus sp. Leaf278 TaxID=1736319 RepID=UPI0007096841|nr:TetR family transcriptional regulator C-terminal domain-containing protein [Rhodococcus sp. Leaf278]KQU58253.1 TetR family transcriptional regulator [Rhodococcus sp. Leaf278]